MLLGTYGRLRQADKAWALFQRLRQLRDGGGAGQEAEEDAATSSQLLAEVRQEPGSPDRQQQQAQQGQQQVQQQRQELNAADGRGRAHAWDARLAQRRAQLAGQAERLVRDLRLEELPWGHYEYGALITALSRVGAG